MTTSDRARRATSGDVARMAGVSRTTVSYVLNGTPHQKIPPATRQRVLDAVARLGYVPSAAARTLKSGRSDVVLCLLPDWPIRFATGAFLDALSSALTRSGLTLLAHPRPATGATGPGPWRTVGPAAVIAWAGSAGEDVAEMRAAGVPVVLLGGPDAGRGDPGIPEARTGRVQAEHLGDVGRRRLGYALPDDPRLAHIAEARLAGVRATCTERGLEPPLVRTVPLDPAAAADAVREWCCGPVTGICAYNDEVALAVLAGMRLLGLTAPDDMAVVGVDDIPAARLAPPPLTTVALDHHLVAQHLAEVVVQSLDGRPVLTGRREPPGRAELAGPPAAQVARLVRRAST